jgi:hypothetical protein
VFLVVVVAGLMLPVAVKVSELAKHAGAASGPLLSVLNFCQSAELFQGLDLHWYDIARAHCGENLWLTLRCDRPKVFKEFCRNVLSLVSSLNVFNFVSKWADLPNPACAFALTYLQRWFLVMLTPILLLIACALSVLAYVCLWKAAGLGELFRRVQAWLVRAFLSVVRCCWKYREQCTCCCRRWQARAGRPRRTSLSVQSSGQSVGRTSASDIRLTLLDDRAMQPEPELEPEPEPEEPVSTAIDRMISAHDDEAAAAVDPYADGHGSALRPPLLNCAKTQH